MKIMISLFLFLGVNLAVHAAEDGQFYIGEKDCKVFNPRPKEGERITWSGPCKDGFAEGTGVLQWYLNDNPGAKTEGEYRHGKQNGKSTQTAVSGAKLVANFEDGKLTGDVDSTAANGVLYQGPWKDGPDGRGVMTFTDGARYEGDFVSGKRTGKGVLEYKNGKRYEGDFVDGKQTGKGIITWPDGGRYAGDVADGQPNGKGTIKLASGDSYEGDFLIGKRTGRGVYVWAKGDRYEGDFIDGKQEGKGVGTYVNGNHYEGSFLNGRFGGEGKMQFANGSHYEGSWKDGKFEGKGTLTSADGKVVAAEFSNGEKISLPSDAVQTAKVEKGRVQICKNEKWPESQKEIEFPADGKFITQTGKAVLQQTYIVTQTDFSSRFDAAAQGQNNVALHDKFKLENRDGKLWVRVDPQGSSCIYLNADGPVLDRTDVTLSASHIAPDWVRGANGIGVNGVSWRYFGPVDQTTYAISEVGKTLSYVVHDMKTGSNLNHDRVQRIPVTNPKVLVLMQDAIELYLAQNGQYDADVIDPGKYNISAQNLDVKSAADVSAFVAQFVKETHPLPHSRLVLALPAKGQVGLKFSNTTLSGGKLEGLGFYRDSNVQIVFDSDHGDYVPITAFANFQLVFIDIDSGKVTAAQTYTDGRMFSHPTASETELAEKTTDIIRLFALRDAVNDGVSKIMRETLSTKK